MAFTLVQRTPFSMAADAARTSIAGLNTNERNSLVKDYIDKNASAYMLIDPSLLTYRIGDSASDPNQYRVELIYDASQLPIWNLYPPLPLPSKHIIYGATIRRGGI